MKPNNITITTIIIAVTLARLYEKCEANALVAVISAFRASLKADHKRAPHCDLKLIELARAIRSDFGYLVEYA